jgi:aspartyl aminopeptidase
MPHQSFNQELLEFINNSPTPFHAVEQLRQQLLAEGFHQLHESENWDLQTGGNYFVIRNASSLIAFVMGELDPVETGIRMVGAHTDSPCLKVKPTPEITEKGYLQLGVEVYGGVLLNPWFDRDLSLAGRVSYLTSEGELKSSLINFVDPIALVPSLAIHLDREQNTTHPINPQKDLPPIVSLLQEGAAVEGDNANKWSFCQLLLERLLEEHPQCKAERILDHELCFYDSQPGRMVGLQSEFMSSARLDNLLSCFVGMKSLCEAGSKMTAMLVCNDHEEVGSSSFVGAQGPMLKSVLERMFPEQQRLLRVIDRSMLISADNAHGVHPNYTDKHDGNHGPLLNGGPVIKVNANQRYASNSETQALFRYLCERVEVPVQSFVVRSDMACGSTIGPITAAEIGVRTLDVGVPTFAMHSIRETAGSKDAWYLYVALQEFYRRETLWTAQVP